MKHYSGGMIRRLEIAQSMLHHPSVLFLDEPTVGLDPVAKQAVWQNVRDLREEFGTTILMTTHDMLEADELCEKVAFMHAGRLAAIGSPAELRSALGSRCVAGRCLHSLHRRHDFRGGRFQGCSAYPQTAKRLG